MYMHYVICYIAERRETGRESGRRSDASTRRPPPKERKGRHVEAKET